MTTGKLRETTLSHLLPALLYTVLSVMLLGIVYPLSMTALAQLLFHNQAEGSYVGTSGKTIGSAIIGQAFTRPEYFHGRPSAAGKNGYDPTSTGATNLAPTSRKLIAGVAGAIKALREESSAATGPIPPDLVTSSASGIDPDISPEAARFQALRVAKARRIEPARVLELIRAHERSRDLGILGEPRVNVLELNVALDRLR
jgi:K+-transporting ATPase ATPase C chain